MRKKKTETETVEEPAGEEEDLEVLDSTGVRVPACRNVVGQLLRLCSG
jgi:hypothetical protein